MVQFKELILKGIDEERRESISKSARSEFSAHFLELPEQCPKSSIVHGHRHPRYKRFAFKIYKKYLQRGSIHELDGVDFETRKFLTDLIQNKKWESNPYYDDPRNL